MNGKIIFIGIIASLFMLLSGMFEDNFPSVYLIPAAASITVGIITGRHGGMISAHILSLVAVSLPILVILVDGLLTSESGRPLSTDEGMGLALLILSWLFWLLVYGITYGITRKLSR